MTTSQIPLPLEFIEPPKPKGGLRENLVALLSTDLDFHNKNSGYASHHFHAFPAKYPPQLPHKFIKGLSQPGDIVLDPMTGSGTTILEAYLNNRQGVGFDIDPLALLLSRVKTTPLDTALVNDAITEVLKKSQEALVEDQFLQAALTAYWDEKTRQFANYWFAKETQKALFALISEIRKISDADIRAFLELIFSAIIITKSGGVSLAFDLAHTRPHRAKVVYSTTGEVLIGHDKLDNPSERIKFLTKKLRSPFDEFEKRAKKNLQGIIAFQAGRIPVQVERADAQCLPLDSNSVDLIVTSPPYAANAIDYMRAHKFSLVWLGYPIDTLGKKRQKYIGGDATAQFEFEQIPDAAANVVAEITQLDEKKGRVLHRYYSEMVRVLREMYRVLRPGKAAIVVVGSSTMRGRDTRTADCLAEIGRSAGFEVPKIGVRQLDRNRRMMPAGGRIDQTSQIQQRMHEEYVIGFYKPRA